MSARRLLVLVIATLLVVACKRTSAPAPVASAPSASASAAVATPPASASASVAANDEIDLLYATRAAIAVSSKVDNPKDYPEHLVDRKPETAWNGKTGDLVGGWIAFRVPKDAFVRRVEITAGFDKVAKDGTDLFTANHRIKRLAVTRDGVAIGEPTLDVDARGPQKIAIDREGGEYKLEVLETVPGTKKEWRELVVSELHVYGTTPRIERVGGEQPRVFVGSLDPPAALDRATYRATLHQWFPTAEAFCAAQMKTVDLKAIGASSEGMTPTRTRPSCKIQKPWRPADVQPPYLGIMTADWDEADSTRGAYIVKTAKGWHLAEAISEWSHYDYDPGCPSLYAALYAERIAMSETTPPVLVVTQIGETIAGGNWEKSQVRSVKACRLRADETVACDEGTPINERTTEADGESKPWPDKDAPFAITAQGKIELLRK
jgi:hypothetical protein